jgi:ParB family chromosome partitioning protein
MEQIKNIPIDLLKPHPKNPRQELRGLCELEASIREKGVLQNLTVVRNKGALGEWNGTFTVVIGHRRLAAAKEAGLIELPCAIVDMTEEEQITTMMSENVQRNDLLPYEQAHGYQTMLDLGISVKDMAAKTGVSERTVYRRLKLTEFDREKLTEASNKAITFDELDRLAQIKDEKRRNDVLSLFGTKDYDWEYQKAMKAQQEQELAEEWRKVLTKAGAEEIKNPYNTGHKNVMQMQLERSKPTALTEYMLDGIKYYFGFAGGWCYLLCEQVKQEMPEETEEERAEREEAERREEEKRENREYLNEMAKHAYRLRTQFIVSISEQTCRDHVNDIIAYLTKLMWTSPSSVAGKWNIEYTMKYTGDEESNGDAKAAKLHEYYAYIHPYKTLLWNACAAFADSEWRKFHNPDCEHIEAAPLRDFYEFLEKLGYTMSREEREMMNGTHEYFIKDEDEE